MGKKIKAPTTLQEAVIYFSDPDSNRTERCVSVATQLAGPVIF